MPADLFDDEEPPVFEPADKPPADEHTDQPPVDQPADKPPTAKSKQNVEDKGSCSKYGGGSKSAKPKDKSSEKHFVSGKGKDKNLVEEDNSEKSNSEESSSEESSSEDNNGSDYKFENPSSSEGEQDGEVEDGEEIDIEIDVRSPDSSVTDDEKPDEEEQYVAWNGMLVFLSLFFNTIISNIFIFLQLMYL